jgi:membrane-associated protease RseP (regulator of RpoE activity)
MEFFSSGWFYLLAALGFGFVIFIHELGHFLFAKWAGVRVERFSIGFGPVVFKKTVGETEYALSLLPLGGYVKMLGQEDLPADITEAVRHDPRSYLAASPWWQAAILLAGVLFNLVSSYIILLCLAWHGMPVFDPVVGAIMPEIEDIRGKPQPSPAVQIGLHQGDRILTFNGRKVRSFDDLTMLVVTAGRDPVSLTVERHEPDGTLKVLELPGGGKTIIMAPDFSSGHPTLGAERPKGWTIDQIENLTSGQPVTGVKAGDRIVAINGKSLPIGATGQQIEDLLRPFLGREVTLGLDPGRRDVTLRYGGGDQDTDLAISYPVRIEKVVPGSAGDNAGLKAGDLLLKVDGVEVGGSSHFQALTRSAMNEGHAFSITVLRDGVEKTVSLNGADISGRRLVGANLVTIRGYLPFIPKAYDGSDSPLAQAHIQAGDAIVGYGDAKPGADRHQAHLLVVSGGKMHPLPMGDDDFLVFKKRVTASPLAKMFGITAVPSIEQQLVDMRVENTGDGHGYPNSGMIHVADHDDVKHSVNLSLLSKATVDALLSDLKPGDWITGVTVLPSNEHALEVVRGAGASPHQVTVTYKDIGTSLVLGPETHPYVLQDWSEAFTIANDAAYTMITKTLQIIPRFFRSTEDGGIDANKSLTGPIGIFSALKGNAERFGFDSYLKLLAIIGLNLFMVNLLPIPITDGGQLLFLGIETLMRKPLPAVARSVATWIGLAMVMALMLYVIGLDILRHLGFL